MSPKDMIKSRKPKATKEAPISPAIPAASKRVPKPAKEKTKPSAGRRVLNFIKKAVPCTSSGAKHHVEDSVQDVSKVAVASRPVRQEPFKALSPVSTKPQVPKVREATVAPRPVKPEFFTGRASHKVHVPKVAQGTAPRLVKQAPLKALPPVPPKRHVSKVSVTEGALAPRPVQQESSKAFSPKHNVAEHEEAPSPIASGSTPTSGNGGAPVLNHVEATAPTPAPRPIAQSDLTPAPIRVPIPAIDRLVGKHLEASRALAPPAIPFSLTSTLVRKIGERVFCDFSREKSDPTRRFVIHKDNVQCHPRIPFTIYIHYQTLPALKEVDEPVEEQSSPSTPAMGSASPSIRDSESESESSATPVNADSPITPEPDLGAKAESDVVEEVSTHATSVAQDVDGDNDNLSEEVPHLTTEAESEEVEVVPTHTAPAADVIVVVRDEVADFIGQAESEDIEDVLLHTTAVQVVDDDDEDVSTVRRQSYGSLLRFIAQVEAEDLEARAHAASVADDDEVSTSRRNSYDSCLSMLERYFEKPWTPSNRRISGQSFRSTQEYFFSQPRCALSDNSVVLPPPSEAGSESEDERPLYGNSDSESDAESIPRRKYDTSEIPNITVWDLINLDMGSDASDSDSDSEDPFVAFNTVEDGDVFVSRRHASRRLAVYGQDQLHARSLSLPVMSTARTATGPRPLLLPMLVAHREGSMQASSSFPSSSGHS